MFNKNLFESICNLTCEKEDFNFNPANRRKVKYDLEDPFIKYYSYDSIVKAFNKYINKEWDDKTLAHWFCVYCWILNGGFSSKTKSSLNLVEELITFIISDYLDGMSFFKKNIILIMKIILQSKTILKDLNSVMNCGNKEKNLKLITLW